MDVLVRVDMKFEPVRTPKVIKKLEDREIVRFAVGSHHVLALDSKGILFSWGNGKIS